MSPCEATARETPSPPPVAGHPSLLTAQSIVYLRMWEHCFLKQTINKTRKQNNWKKSSLLNNKQVIYIQSLVCCTRVFPPLSAEVTPCDQSASSAASWMPCNTCEAGWGDTLFAQAFPVTAHAGQSAPFQFTKTPKNCQLPLKCPCCASSHLS